MCLAVPVKVLELLKNNKAKVAVDGVSLEVSTSFTPDVQVDDYVIVHAGFVLEKITPEDASLKLQLWDEYLEKTGRKLC
ncbi:MAG: hypothetical protein A2381_19840 [Bdellovibrionales bacterium RIFOXYB1_FULL_37_110]|nr:MAG: hypothetical protein A2181_03475 [Bdellovibrionales bacterium RIFOXYA1_FULL_38_20]OFZ50990.1 MAG: hypothetical protein A2417_19625 [Bdellovibrionales bacterium RIFOXYC1_FULL_37_79]OFZ60202.1 MAG: hypothetical protein A2381_19840 [Bdellovibrionales bacterium RIFOXYB1_FULL_37_110]OFZ61564.1 MAG: hypothetical protein A2577_10280 [Bdellovibrionales bacterium RIFOXYD1_FULL_36_51]